MTKKIALLRGVNVGGHNKLPMNDLASELEKAGCNNVRTYVQSGNIIFEGAVTAEEFGAIIEKRFGFHPQVWLLSAAVFKKAAEQCPYRQEGDEAPKNVHLSFLEKAPGADVGTKFDEIKTPSEQYSIIGKTLYLHTPDGFRGSNIAAKADRILKVKTTSRNWNTINALIDICEGRK